MAIFTFEEAVKKAGVKPNSVTSLGVLSPERQNIVNQKRTQALEAEAEAQRISSPFGQLKEFGKEVGEISGFTPTGRRIAAAIAPYTESEEDFSNMVEELVGGVTKERKMGTLGKTLKELGASKNLAEGVDIAADLPLISLGLSKNIAKALSGQAGKSSIETLKLLDKPLLEFLPDKVRAALKTDITTPIKEKTGEFIEGTKDVLGGAVDKTKTTLFGRPKQVNNIDDVIKQVDEALKETKPADILTKTEEVTAKPNILQRWAGISPDIKNRIAGKQEKLKEYFDVAHARNNFDTLPTPLEHGAKQVDTAVTKMEGVLNDTGSDIGKFRKKVSTYKANIDNVNKVEGAFNNELSRLNLEIKNGVIRQKAGTIKRVNSDAEVKALNELYGELQIVKQSPDLQRLIDLRNLFDSKINFAKSTREVSSSLDPLSRNVRKQIADTAAEIVGKSEAGNLKKYADFIDAFNELKSYTDRKAGAEFLLKQVLSERGRSPREVIQTIKEITEIDLMDDAVMSSLTTDLIGNSRQKGVFRQEITKAGLDAQAALRGDTKGAVELMFSFLKKGLVNEEKQFLKAAK
ncbi:MAG: hypothetical protein AAB875_03525 [Patescibacteria group bacterium]